MRRVLASLVLLVSTAAAGCQDATGPDRHSVLGYWRGENIAGLQLEMVLSETAREVGGAGRLIQGDSTLAFSVSGSNTGESVSLLLEFESRPAINFLGFFEGEDVIDGTLAGGAFVARPARLVRIEGDERLPVVTMAPAAATLQEQ